MKCIDMGEQISLYIDNMLDEHNKEAFMNHMAECNQCKAEYDSLIATVNLCKELPMLELPEDYEMCLHSKLVATKVENQRPVDEGSIAFKKPKKRINWKIYTSIAAIFMIFVISVTGLNNLRMGKSTNQSEMARNDSTMEAPASPEEFGSNGITQFSKSQDSGVAEESIIGRGGEQDLNIMPLADEAELQISLTGRKVIKNAFVHLDIENYDEKFEQIINLVNMNGGYIEHSDTQYKYYIPDRLEESLKIGSITARIPENIFLSIVDQVKNIGIVTNFGLGGQDITMQYRDTANEVENLKIQEERLREIMNKAINVKDILEVERELSRVRGNINRMTGDIKRWDDLVGLSTIHISLNEVVPKDKKIQPVSDNIWEKASKGFIRTINSMVSILEAGFVGFISILPLILVVLIILVPIILFIKRIRRRE